MRNVIGMDAQKAVKILEKEGYCCLTKEYSPPKPMETDCVRVIRQKETDERMVELTISGFKTKISTIPR